MTALVLLIWIVYFGAIGLSFVALRTINVRMLTFMDGILIGCVYYIVIPMFFILLHGELYPEFLMTASYLPYVDIHTTVVLLFGMYLMPLLALVTRSKPTYTDKTDRRLLPTTLILFAASTIYGFVNSGILSGGHWYHAATEQLQNDAGFLLIKHLANFARTAAFAVLFYSTTRGWLTARQAALYGLCVALADMTMTFNRITAVYYLIMLALVFRHRAKTLALCAAIGLPALIFVNGLFPMFRGMLSVTGTSPSGILEAAEISISRYDASTPFVSSMGSIFESVDIIALNFVVHESGRSIPLQMGSMFIRPLTFFLPRIIWANRPEGIGNLLGSIMNNADDLALNSTLFGESFANFGDFWFIALTTLLLANHYLFRFVGGHSRATGAIAAFIGFAIWRFDTVFAVISLVLTALIALGLKLSSSSTQGKPRMQRTRLRRTVDNVSH